MKRKIVLVAALLGALSQVPAGAVEYNRIDAAKSALGFGYTQMGVAMKGGFSRFAATLKFDPAKPAAAKASFDVHIASVDAGSADANKELAGKDWFDSAHYPLVHFEATRIAPLGGNRYQVDGKLTIKGRTRDVSTPATLTTAGNSATLEGGFAIKRGEFGVGEGAWADFGIVANAIQINFKLLALSGK